MGLSQQFYIEAEQELQNRRKANERNLALRREEIAEKLPQIEQLRLQLAQTGYELSTIFFSDTTDVKEKLAALEQRNLMLQAKIEELLLLNGYPSKYLSGIYSCELCKDTGVNDNKRCKCFMDIVRRLASNAINVKSPIQLSSFDTFDLSLYPDETDKLSGQNCRRVMERNFQRCREYAENFHLPSIGIVLNGKTGLGKTHLSLAIANEVLAKGYSVIYGSAPDFLRKIEQVHFGRNNGTEDDPAELLQTIDLLIFDDLGAEFSSPFYSATVYNIINTRMNSGLPIVFSTNCALNELKEKYGERVTSRLLTMDFLYFCGNDNRVRKRYS